MPRTRTLFLTLLLFPLFAPPILAQGAPEASQAVPFSVAAVQALAVAEQDGPLWVDSSGTGQFLSEWAITTNLDDISLVVSAPHGLPEGVTLDVRAEAPPGGTARDNVRVDRHAGTLVSGISRAQAGGLKLSYHIESEREAWSEGTIDVPLRYDLGSTSVFLTLTIQKP